MSENKRAKKRRKTTDGMQQISMFDALISNYFSEDIILELIYSTNFKNTFQMWRSISIYALPMASDFV